MSGTGDDTLRTKCLECEQAFREAFETAAGDRDGLRLSVSVAPRASVLLALKAEAEAPGRESRSFEADLPLVDAVQFARGFGAHLGSSLKE